jgi:hypothetical protein
MLYYFKLSVAKVNGNFINIFISSCFCFYSVSKVSILSSSLITFVPGGRFLASLASYFAAAFYFSSSLNF